VGCWVIKILNNKGFYTRQKNMQQKNMLQINFILIHFIISIKIYDNFNIDKIFILLDNKDRTGVYM